MRRARTLAVLAVAAVLQLGAERPPGLGDVADVRHWSYDDYTRVVIELSRPVDTQVVALPSDRAAGRPERLYVDLDGIWVGRRYVDPIPVGDGLLRGVRLGQNTLTRARVVIDLERIEHHRLLRLSDPDRVVIDVFGRRAAAPPHVAARTPRERLPLPQRPPLEARPVETVVIDAGHGGRDPGAVGVNGLLEKDVTLRLARVLRARLESRGFRVVLTRDGDRTLSLEERTALAEGTRGDLFVSLHANASRRRAARGIETYFLDTGAERQSLRVAARENGIPPNRLDALQRTLTHLRVAEISDRSELLARLVQREMVSGAAARHPDTADLGVKRGPFYVLFLSSMPSILVEAGFITHREESRRLRHFAYLETLADRIARGVEAYRERVTPRVARGAP